LLVLGVAVLLVALIGTGIYGFLGGLYAYAPRSQGGTAQVARPGERINILLLGVDGGLTEDDEGKVTGQIKDNFRRTDTMLLLSFDPEEHTVGIISIPRDTRVLIPGHGWQKIAHAHAFGGPGLAMETVEAFLGVPVHHYVRTNFEGFSHIIDALGGVEFTVERRLHYEDPLQNLYIDLKPGRQLIDGEKAIQLLRFRSYPNGDIGRVEVQQKFLKALLDKVFDTGIILKLPSLAREISRYVTTDLKPGEILSLATSGMRVKREAIRWGVVPGHDQMIGGLSYWIADNNGTQRLVGELVRGVDLEASSHVTLEILNGTDVPGLAGQLATYFQNQGFKVVRTANADRSDYAETRIYYHRQDDPSLNNVPRALLYLVESPKIYKAYGDGFAADVTIILGRDLAKTRLGGN